MSDALTEHRTPNTEDPRAEEAAATGSPWAWASACAGVAALVAAWLGWGIGELLYGYYAPSAAAQRNRFEFARLNQEQGLADQKNAAITFGTFGALLGLAGGVAGGALRRSAPAAIGAALAGFLLGGVGAALVSAE